MKTLILTIVFFAGLNTFVFSQNLFSVEDVKVEPGVPTIADSLKVSYKLTLFHTYHEVYKNWEISGDTILINACYIATGGQSASVFKDTISIGKLPDTGKYYLNLVIYESGTNPFECEYIYMGSYLDSFMVYKEFTSVFPEDQNTKFSLRPNPATDQQILVLTTDVPQKLSINLYDLSGRLVKKVYSGSSFTGEQVYQANLSGLSPGVYIYKIRIGNELLHAKTIKN